MLAFGLPEGDLNARCAIEGAMIGAVAGLVASWTMSEFHRAWKAKSDGGQDKDEPNTVKVADALEYPLLSSGFWNPHPMGLKQDVCEYHELSHDGGESNFRGLSADDESHGGAPPGGQRRVWDRLRCGCVVSRGRIGDASARPQSVRLGRCGLDAPSRLCLAPGLRRGTRSRAKAPEGSTPLRCQGYTVEDHWLRTHNDTDAYKAKHGVDDAANLHRWRASKRLRRSAQLLWQARPRPQSRHLRDTAL